jgi:hypothetical protein
MEESAVDVGSTDDVSRLQDIVNGISKNSKRRILTHLLILGKMETAELYRGWFRGWLIRWRLEIGDWRFRQMPDR